MSGETASSFLVPISIVIAVVVIVADFALRQFRREPVKDLLGEIGVVFEVKIPQLRKFTQVLQLFVDDFIFTEPDSLTSEAPPKA